jgi:hypothetical protein
MSKCVGSEGNPHLRAERRANAIVELIGNFPQSKPDVQKRVFFPAFVPFSHRIEFTSISVQYLPETLS